MGINATVVYDVKTHTTLILRTNSVAPLDRHKVLDTIASFAQHCESLRGVTRSVVQVTSLWGGPPFIAYDVALNRYRTMVIWEDHPHDFDLAYDVHHALLRLSSAVKNAGDAFLRSEQHAVATVYDEAGYALLAADDPILLPTDDSEKPAPRSKLLPIPTAVSRRSSVTEPKNKSSTSNQSATANTSSSGLFSRLGNAIRGPPKPARKVQEPRAPQTLPPGKDCPFGSEAALDDELGPLALPDDFFTWCDFGSPLSPDERVDLSWLVDLATADRPVPALSAAPDERRPLLRAGSVPSTPLTIPSSASPLSHAQSGPSSISPAALEESDVPQNANPSAASATQPAEANSQQPTVSPTILDPNAAIPSNVAGKPVLPANIVSSADNFTVMSDPGMPQLPPIQEMKPPIMPQAVTPQPARPPDAITPASTFSQPSPPTVPIHPGAQNIPPALAKRPDDFDVAGLGIFKDTATSATGGEGSEADDQAIRGRMNEFATTMQGGNFALALQQIVDTLRFLSTRTPRRERETRTCANYVLAQKILMRNAVVESELARTMTGTPDAMRRLVECALLTMFLAEMKHILPRHRVAAMRLAVEKNFVVGNFGMCARWLRQLVEKAPVAQRGALANKLQMCMANGERNTHMPPTNRLCYSSLQVVGVPYGKCSVCDAVFHATLSGLTEGQTCDICFVGSIGRKVA